MRWMYAHGRYQGALGKTAPQIHEFPLDLGFHFDNDDENTCNFNYIWSTKIEKYFITASFSIWFKFQKHVYFQNPKTT